MLDSLDLQLNILVFGDSGSAARQMMHLKNKFVSVPSTLAFQPRSAWALLNKVHGHIFRPIWSSFHIIHCSVDQFPVSLHRYARLPSSTLLPALTPLPTLPHDIFYHLCLQHIVSPLFHLHTLPPLPLYLIRPIYPVCPFFFLYQQCLL